MPRIRTLKPDFFTSPDTAQVDFPVRIFYQALWCWADDFGIGETNLNGLLGFAFPDSDGFSAQDLRRFCADCARHYGVTFYTVRGRHYYCIGTWDKHQKLEKRTDRRKYPTPDDPDATPDVRIYGCADSAPDMPRRNGAESGGIGAGNRNRGTGEIEEGLLTEVCHQGDDQLPPPRKCPKHINEVTTVKCGPCADARRAHDAYQSRKEHERRLAAESRREAINACVACDDNGMVESHAGLVRCDHLEVAHV